jgi:hypothetical protein
MSRYDTLKSTAQELMKRQSHNKTDVDVMVDKKTDILLLIL